MAACAVRRGPFARSLYLYTGDGWTDSRRSAGFLASYGGGRASGWLRYPPGFGLHQRPRCQWHRAFLQALDRCHAGVLRHSDRHRVRYAPRALKEVEMPRMLINLLGGTLFGLGLTISEMVNPAKIVGFLDVAGNWDPTLAFVFG